MLLFKECKKMIFSLTFLIYLIAVGGFYFTQFASDADQQIKPPSQVQRYYGDITKEIPEVLMPAAAKSLATEYLRGYYIAYPLSFYKEVRLSEQDNTLIAEIITEITGISKQELDCMKDFAVLQETAIPEIQLPNTMTYEHFRELMRRADKIIGGGSMYSDAYIIDHFSLIPRTYEDALADYNEIMEKDRITGAYARLFCDYIGIIVSILPVFMAVSLTNADEKSRCEQVIYTRKISSAKLIFTRFFALSVILVIPVMLLSAAATLQVKAIYPDNTVDLFAITKMSIYWLVPNILFGTAFGMSMAELFSPLIAVFLQGALWISSVISGAGNLTGGIGKFTLVCRHNSLGDRYLFMEDLNNFIFNRSFYTALSLLFVLLTIGIYNLKRKGDFRVLQKRTYNFQNKFKA